MPMQVQADVRSTGGGLVEGYHGGIWTRQMRISMIELCASLGVGSYVYAPADDPYVGGPDWIMPYPHGRADDLKEIMELCSEKGIEFVWCVRPDKDFDWSENQYRLLLGKLEMMHFMGVRSFGVFLNAVPGVTEERKSDLVHRIDEDFISKKKGVPSLVTDIDWCYVPEGGGESIRLGLYGHADYIRDPSGYDPKKSLTDAVNATAPDVADAYITFASHSAVAPEYFRLKESAGIEPAGLDSLDEGVCKTLSEEFRKIEMVQEIMASGENKALYRDLEPWLIQFSALGRRCGRILDCVSYYRSGDTQAFWTTYAANLMSDEDMKAYLAHPSGQEILHPFYERMMTELFEAYKSRYKDSVMYEHYRENGMEVFIAPDEASCCHLVIDNPQGREVIVRLADSHGRYVAEFCMESSYLEFELKENAVKVEVLGDNDILETVFVK